SPPAPVYFMAESSVRRGEMRDAAHAYRLFINDPGNDGRVYIPRAYYMLAYAHYRLSEYEEALATLDEFEEKYPDSNLVQVWALRGDTSRALGKRVNGLQEWDEAWRFAGQMDRLRLERRITQT